MVVEAVARAGVELADVDVALVSWNTRERTLKQLGLLLGGTPSSGAGPNVVVVDNASADGSAKAVREAFPSVELTANASNRLFALAANQAAASGVAPYLLLLNPDCELDRESLTALRDQLQAHPGWGAVAPRLLHATGQTQACLMERPRLLTPFFFGTPLERWAPHSAELERWFCRGVDHEVEQYVAQPPAACFLVRREVWEQLGGFDPNLELFFNDTDFCARMQEAGWPIRYLSSLGVVHHTGSATRQLDDFSTHWHRDRLRYHRKHHGALGTLVAKLATSWSALDQLWQTRAQAGATRRLLQAWGRFLLQ